MPENIQEKTFEEETYIPKRTWRDSSFGSVVVQFSRNKSALVGLILILLLVLMGLLAPVISPYEYTAIDPIHANEGPSAEHWFGTDSYGRDILSRIFWGARTSMAIGVGSS